MRQTGVNVGKSCWLFCCSRCCDIWRCGATGDHRWRWATLSFAVYLGTTLGDGPPVDNGDTWIWILAGTDLRISMLVETGFLMDFSSVVTTGVAKMEVGLVVGEIEI